MNHPLKTVTALWGLFCFFSVQAAVEVTSPETWNRYRGSTIEARGFLTKKACQDSAPLDVSRRCVGSETFVRRADPPPPPPPTCPAAPSPQTQQAACPAGTTGTFSQTRTASVGPPTACTVTWGPWAPATPPAGSCPPVPPPPPPPTGAGVLTATRTSGPAPLAVLFDATGNTGGTYPFHDITYSFDFGDNRGQAWAISGASKNTQAGGPLAAHVFDLPGAYTVRMRTSTGAEATVTVTVTNPDAHWAGTNTVCVSTSANYTGCPAGATMQTSLPSITSGKRILLRRGESFGGISVPRSADNVLIGAFGSGNKPRVSSVYVNAGNPNGQWSDDVTVMDLQSPGGVTQQDSGARHLYYRLDLGGGGIEFAAALDYWSERGSGFYTPRELFFVENTGNGNRSAPFLSLSGIGSRVAILGNDLGNAQQHTIRLFNVHKTVIAHNAARGGSSDSNRHALKLHGSGLGAYADSYTSATRGWAASQVVIADNLFGDANDNNYWTVALRPQNEESAEGIEDVVAERNRFVRGRNTNTDYLMVGRRMTTRDNVRVDGGALNIDTHPGGRYPLPTGWRGPYWMR